MQVKKFKNTLRISYRIDSYHAKMYSFITVKAVLFFWKYVDLF